MAGRTAVGLVEDDRHFRLYLEAAVAASPRHRLAGSAGTGAEALAWPRGGALDVILLDVGLPDRSGTALVPELLARFPDVLVIMLSGVAEEGVILEAVRNGAVGYVLKGAREAEILAAIDDALAGGAPMSPMIARRVLTLLRVVPAARDGGAGLAGLSPREKEVIERVADGASDKEVAEALGIARSTVKNVLLSIYQKWRVRSRTEAAVKFVRASRG